ncbi:MAG: hypothetical protein RIM84_25135 [Alphaproteobacteria bacterium]
MTALAALRRKIETARRLPGLWQTKLADPWLGLAARRRLPGLAASLLRRQVVPLAGAVEPAADAWRVLVLPKPGLIEDVLASLGRDPRYRLFALRREAPKALARPFFPATVDDNTYGIGDPAIDAGKAPCRDFLAAAWRGANAELSIDACVTGNFSYYAEQELAAAMEAAGTVFVALHKENLKTPGLEPLYEEIYRDRKGPFLGTAIATYNEIERGIQTRAGTFPPERITVAGMARLDHIHRWREDHAGRDASSDPRPTVLFMSFNEKTGSPYIGRKTADGQERLAPELEAVRWTGLVREAHAAVAELARRHPDLRVIIKTKDHAWAMGALRRGLGEGFAPPANLEIVTGGDPLALICACDVLCGFNSTSLFEGMAAAKPIVVPHFAEAADPRFAPYVVDLGDAAARPDSAEAMIEALAETARRRVSGSVPARLDAAAQAMLQHWVGNPDGGAGARARDLLAGLLAARAGAGRRAA